MRNCCTYNSFVVQHSETVVRITVSQSEPNPTVPPQIVEWKLKTVVRTTVSHSTEVSTVRGGTNGFGSECETVVRTTVLSPTVSAVRGSTSGSGSECETVLRTTVLSSTSAPKLLYVQQFDIPNQFCP